MMMIKFGKQTKDLNRRKKCVEMNIVKMKVAPVIHVHVQKIIAAVNN